MGAFLVDGDQSRRIMTEVATALSVAAVVASVVILVGLNRDNDPLDGGRTSQTQSPSATTSPPTETPTGSPTRNETPSPTSVGTEELAMVTEIKDMTVDPADYTGACPVALTFSARIVTNTGPVKATYRWLDVDSAVVEEDTVQFGGPGPQGVTVTHTVSVPDDATVVRRVEVTSPNSLLSDPVETTVTCTPTAETFLGHEFDAICQAPFTIIYKGTITVPHDMTVTYKWERSDGANAPTQTVNFTDGGQQSTEVETTWTLSASGTFSQRLHLLTPFDVVSNWTDFQLC